MGMKRFRRTTTARTGHGDTLTIRGTTVIARECIICAGPHDIWWHYWHKPIVAADRPENWPPDNSTRIEFDLNHE